MNGEDWSATMRRMNHRLSVALELFPIPPWTEELANRQCLFAAEIASGHWAFITGWQANFDNMPSRKRGRPLVKWDDKLSHLVRSGQACTPMASPVLGRRRKKHNMYTTAIYMRQKLTNEGKCEFHTTSSTSLHDPRFAYLQYPSMSWTAHATSTNRLPR